MNNTAMNTHMSFCVNQCLQCSGINIKTIIVGLYNYKGLIFFKKLLPKLSSTVILMAGFFSEWQKYWGLGLLAYFGNS